MVEIKKELRHVLGECVRFFPQNIAFIRTYHRLIKSKCEEERKKIRFVFLIQKCEVWNSIDSVYRILKKSKESEVILVAIPPLVGAQLDYSSQWKVKSFCEEKEPDELYCAINEEDGSVLDLQGIRPDYIFIDEPYTDYYPSEYRMHLLARIAPICYIPYGYTLAKGPLQKITLDQNVLRYISFIFAENSITFKYVQKRIWLSELLTHRRVYDYGFPRFDLYQKPDFERRMNEKTVVTWMPRWTGTRQIKMGNEPSTFLDLKDSILDFFEMRQDVQLIIRPHPKAFVNYIQSGDMTEAEVRKYKDRVNRLGNVYIDESSDYLPTLLKTDILIADFTSLLAEFFITGRAIIYSGQKKSNMPKEIDNIYSSFYYASNDWDSIENILCRLLSKDDPLKSKRRELSSAFLSKYRSNIGQSIVELLIDRIRH